MAETGDSILSELGRHDAEWAPWRPASSAAATPLRDRRRDDEGGDPPRAGRSARYHSDTTRQRLQKREFKKVCWECGLSEHERAACMNVIDRVSLRLARTASGREAPGLGPLYVNRWRPEHAMISEEDFADCRCIVCDKPGSVDCCSPRETGARVPSCCRCGDSRHRSDDCGLLHGGNDWHGTSRSSPPPPPPPLSPTPPGPMCKLPAPLPPPAGGSRGSRLPQHVASAMPPAAGRGSAPPLRPPARSPPPPVGRGRGSPPPRWGGPRDAPGPSGGGRGYSRAPRHEPYAHRGGGRRW
eukprot:TRINITY_DN4384_c1_g1_i1.p1 TRINITY_DN4384_c1_g1~~TRINITY_DN4384_c1_g1_i1.p1  ORF type:complete len:298 (+),score=62.68 TRINITY_DN4384_c1_g1_i1:79-972(+)